MVQEDETTAVQLRAILTKRKINVSLKAGPFKEVPTAN